MPPGLHVRRITPLCQLQDLGRVGYQRYGVSRSGAMDPRSLRLANILAGNPQNEACLEFALAGAMFEVTAKRLHFAFVGDFPVIINGETFPANASYTVTRGEGLEIGASDASRGTHGYLAVLGGFAAEPQLGSLSTHLRSGIEGFCPAWSRPKAAPTGSLRRPKVCVGAASSRDRRIGLTLPTKLDDAPLAVERHLPEALLPQPADNIRAVPGPQTEYFSEASTEHFFATGWQIAANSDRMGYRLEGGTIEAEEAGSMISEGVSPGSVQVPAGGQPIVLMADCGTVGGYPKIATVISADRGRLAQLRFGARFGFEAVGVDTAQALLRNDERALQQFAEDMAPA